MKPIQYNNRVDYKKQIEKLENQRKKVYKLESDLKEAKERLKEFPESRVIKVKKEVGDLSEKEAKAQLNGRNHVQESVQELEQDLELQRDALKAIELKTDGMIRRIKMDCRLANSKTAAQKSIELFDAMNTVRDILGQLKAFERKCDTHFDIIGVGAEVSGPAGQEYVYWRDNELKKAKAVLAQEFDLLELEADA